MAEKTKESMSFEKAMTRLEEIAKLLEKGDAPLEQSLSLFEEAASLIKLAQRLLDKAEQKVKLLSITPDGEPVLEDFEPEEV